MKHSSTTTIPVHEPHPVPRLLNSTYLPRHISLSIIFQAHLLSGTCPPSRETILTTALHPSLAPVITTALAPYPILVPVLTPRQPPHPSPNKARQRSASYLKHLKLVSACKTRADPGLSARRRKLARGYLTLGIADSELRPPSALAIGQLVWRRRATDPECAI